MDIMQHKKLYWKLFAANQTKIILNFFSDLHILSCNGFFYLTANEKVVFWSDLVFIKNK